MRQRFSQESETEVNRLFTDRYDSVCGGVCTSADGIILQEHVPVIMPPVASVLFSPQILRVASTACFSHLPRPVEITSQARA